MLISLLICCTHFLLAWCQSQTKVPPPPNRGSEAAFFIYKDVDEIARPGGATNVCAAVKAIRSQCYALGVQKKSYADEQSCLCAPSAAFAITQCFASQYSASTNQTVKSQLYTSFLYYTYDCYCGVKPVDPSYNASSIPVQAYITGYTGDAILPPVNGCPSQAPPANICPSPPPCSSCSIPPQPAPQPCPSGFNRCGTSCVPNPPVTPPCAAPKVYDRSGACVCPYGLRPVGADSCEVPPCPSENMEYIINPRGGACLCIGGYEWTGSRCEAICPAGEERLAPGAPCTKTCTSPLLKDWAGDCVCPWSLGYHVVNGVCQKFTCTPPFTVDPYYPACNCLPPYYLDAAGGCKLSLCSTPGDRACYPDLPPIANDTIAISSSPPSFVSSFSDIASVALPATPVVFGSASAVSQSSEEAAPSTLDSGSFSPPGPSPLPPIPAPVPSVSENPEPTGSPSPGPAITSTDFPEPSPSGPTPGAVDNPLPPEPSQTEGPTLDQPSQEQPPPEPTQADTSIPTVEESGGGTVSAMRLRQVRWARGVPF